MLLLVNGVVWIRFRSKINYLQTQVAGFRLQAQESERFIDNYCSSGTLVSRNINTVLEFGSEDFDRILFAKEPRQLVLVFSQENCMTCIISQLRILAKIQELVADKKSLRVVGITDGPQAWTNRLIRTFTLRFPIYTDVNFTTSLRNHVLPLVTLIDKKQSILAAHRPISGKENFSLVFYGIIQDKLDLSSSIFDFKDNKPSDIVTQRVTLDEYAHLIY